MLFEQRKYFLFLRSRHAHNLTQGSIRSNVNILKTPNINHPLLFERVSDKGREVPGLKNTQDIMSEIFMATNLLMSSGVFVDLLPQFSKDSFALWDFVEEWRLDMSH